MSTQDGAIQNSENPGTSQPSFPCINSESFQRNSKGTIMTKSLDNSSDMLKLQNMDVLLPRPCILMVF